MSKEGRKIKTVDPMDCVSIFVMPSRDAASNYFSDSIEITECEKYIKRKREEGLKGFGMLHVITAAYVRTCSQKPGLNRFIRGQRRYARNGMEISMVVKKEMKLDAPETCVKLMPPLDATAEDIYRLFNSLIEENRLKSTQNGADGVAKLLARLPGVLLKSAVGFIRFLDYFGLLPRSLTLASPFHASLFITNLASLGIQPVYHHLYDLGNLPVFLAIGAKYEKREVDREGVMQTKRYMDITAVCDERICDGHYYAACFKQMRSIFKKPDLLDLPPERIVEDVR